MGTVETPPRFNRSVSSFSSLERAGFSVVSPTLPRRFLSLAPVVSGGSGGSGGLALAAWLGTGCGALSMSLMVMRPGPGSTGSAETSHATETHVSRKPHALVALPASLMR